MTPLVLRDGVTLYFCRHGETQANVQLRFQGRTVDTPLTDKGRAQAEAIGHALLRECRLPVALAYVSSPLQRAKTTMEIIRETAGLAREGYTTDTRLLEINLGAWDGLTDAEAEALNPAVYEMRMANKGEIRVPGGGENYPDVAARLENWVHNLNLDTFAVSHGAATRILRGLFQGLGWQQISDLDEKQGVLFRVRGSTIERFDPLDALSQPPAGPHPPG
jgi:probable phosphoglycerate mutase